MTAAKDDPGTENTAMSTELLAWQVQIYGGC